MLVRKKAIIFTSIVLILGAAAGGYLYLGQKHDAPLPRNPFIKKIETHVEGDIDEIQSSLSLGKSVSVIVSLKGNKYTAVGFFDDAKRKAESTRINESVIRTLDDDEAKIGHRFWVSPAFSARLLKMSALEKLTKNQTVTSIHIDRPIRLDDCTKGPC